AGVKELTDRVREGAAGQVVLRRDLPQRRVDAAGDARLALARVQEELDAVAEPRALRLDDGLAAGADPGEHGADQLVAVMDADAADVARHARPRRAGQEVVAPVV